MKQLIFTITLGYFNPPKQKKLYTTCLQYSYSISLHFPYNIIHLPDGCEANVITFVLPSNNRLNIDSIMESTENKSGFNRSYSKINNFSLMQSLQISSLTDENLKAYLTKYQNLNTCMCSAKTIP